MNKGLPVQKGHKANEGREGSEGYRGQPVVVAFYRTLAFGHSPSSGLHSRPVKLPSIRRPKRVSTIF